MSLTISQLIKKWILLRLSQGNHYVKTSDIETSLSQGSPLPAFARGAAEAAKATMQARGLGASTMLAEALAEGILKSSVPIAAADAETYKQVIFQNKHLDFLI